jgi:hypothetical protein
MTTLPRSLKSKRATKFIRHADKADARAVRRLRWREEWAAGPLAVQMKAFVLWKRDYRSWGFGSDRWRWPGVVQHQQLRLSPRCS